MILNVICEDIISKLYTCINYESVLKFQLLQLVRYDM